MLEKEKEKAMILAKVGEKDVEGVVIRTITRTIAKTMIHGVEIGMETGMEIELGFKIKVPEDKTMTKGPRRPPPWLCRGARDVLGVGRAPLAKQIPPRGAPWGENKTPKSCEISGEARNPFYFQKRVGNVVS